MANLYGWRRAIRDTVVSIFMAAGGMAALPASAADPVLPQYGQDTHLGVVTCAGSTCHGSVQTWPDSTVLQNEYITWQKNDKHAKAYAVLLNEQSKRIAANLGLKDAHTADLCLDCHANNPPQNLRGKTFQISDGVGCEACHGGAVRWLGLHVSGTATHADNIAAGLYPTEEPIARAKLCLSCHFGMDKKFVTHRIMGAGHPRMAFELDTFTAVQPAHFKVDADYRKRKQVSNGVQTWAIGQAVALSEMMAAMMDPKRGRDGIFPELVLFDCHACHHPMSNLRWQPRASTGLGPGVPKINDANMIMLYILARQIDPDSGKGLRDAGLAMHKASTQGAEEMATAAAKVKEIADRLVNVFAKHKFNKETMQALLDGALADGRKGEYVEYAAAEQATMAISAIINAMGNAGYIDGGQLDAMNKAAEGLYDAVAKDEEYKPQGFVAALTKFQASVPK